MINVIEIIASLIESIILTEFTTRALGFRNKKYAAVKYSSYLLLSIADIMILPSFVNSDIIPGVAHRLVTASEEIENRVEKEHDNDGKGHSQHHVQHKDIAQHTLCRVIIPLPQLDGNQCRGSHTHQRAERRSQIHQRESQRQSRNSHRPNAVTDEDTVYHII